MRYVDGDYSFERRDDKIILTMPDGREIVVGRIIKGDTLRVVRPLDKHWYRTLKGWGFSPILFLYAIEFGYLKVKLSGMICKDEKDKETVQSNGWFFGVVEVSYVLENLDGFQRCGGAGTNYEPQIVLRPGDFTEMKK